MVETMAAVTDDRLLLRRLSQQAERTAAINIHWSSVSHCRTA